ncbi:MAG TPA: phosphatidylserine/phosphatidylglycerophosphate/cardiolipin synthase family protein [Candidatus Saccharimonadales bacterium]|nr:phosphatidylserine/phosphatidylglycerophosphate/cardiolipin synthase family protein [Candidatus Saccharimonadales bacterium]
MRRHEDNVGEAELLRCERFHEESPGLAEYELFSGGESSLKAMNAAIAETQDHFDAQFFSFEADEVGLETAEAMMTAAGNGKRGRVLIDSFILYNQDDRYLYLPWRDRETRTRLFDKFTATKNMIRNMRGEGLDVKVGTPGLPGPARLGRNHGKLVLVDEGIEPVQSAWLGGVNPTEPNASWHDLMVKITSQTIAGHPIRSLQSTFDQTWKGWTSRGIYLYAGGLVAADAPGVGAIFPLALRLIERANESVVLESPYLHGRHIWRALARAASRDVEASVIVPLNNHKRFGTPNEKVLERATNDGINVYRYAANNGMTHARGLRADNWAMVGSYPFNHLISARLAELAMATPDPFFVESLDDFFANDIEKSEPHMTS